MTVVSVRCHKCDEVKEEEYMEYTADGAVCDDCRTSKKAKKVNDIEPDPEPPDEDESAEEATEEPEEEAEEEDTTTDSFTQQDALSW